MYTPFSSLSLDFIQMSENAHLVLQIITRDFEPCKPHPAPVLNICDKWGLHPSQVAVVGDDKTDMISGLRAGTAGKYVSYSLIFVSR